MRHANKFIGDKKYERTSKKIVYVRINNTNVKLHLDTDCDITLINENT